MNATTLDKLETELRKRRDALMKEGADAEADLEAIARDRESEFEERAQEERAGRVLARLRDRSTQEIEEIDAALLRVAQGSYGVCTDCGRRIGARRLLALPAAACCKACADRRQLGRAAGAAEAEVPPAGPVPADLRLLSDRELEASIKELVRQDGRVDTDELRLLCRHGVVYVDGAVPSETEHRILTKLLTDVAGLREIVDRLRVQELSWEREERSKRELAGSPLPPSYEPAETEDIVESEEEGLEYAPPTGPPSDEE
jgi:RNA polymerase-binding protein DksA